MSTFTIRERPRLDLSVRVVTPTGVRTHWSWQDPNPIYAPKDMSFGTVMPGGFERFTCTLERNPQLSYQDNEELSTLTVMGPGGSVAWEGRIEKLPDTGGFQTQETVEAVGWQAHLEDDNEVREIFVDRELSRWEASPLASQISIVEEGFKLSTGSVAPSSTELPALLLETSGPWELSGRPAVVASYDAKGIPIATLSYAWSKGANINAADGNWVWDTRLQTDEVGAEADSTANLRGAGPGTGSLSATTSTRVWGRVVLYYAAGGGEDKPYVVYWPVLAIYGRHGLITYGTISQSEVPGVLASDVVAYTIGKWAPTLKYSTGPRGTIQTSAFVIEQLAFIEPTTVSEIVKQATRFELEDWAVWEGPTFYMNERGARGKKWKARVGPASLQEAGPQISRLWNGVIVSYTDVGGKSRIVGPPGYAGAEPESTDYALLDSDPENPLNKLGIRKWAILKMGTATPAGAKAVGARFLQESKLLESAGQATLNGYVEDESGTCWPAWMVRGGDQISFIDAANPGYRRIVSTNYDDSSKTNTIQLDQPPDSMQALLERLSVTLTPLGLS